MIGFSTGKLQTCKEYGKDGRGGENGGMKLLERRFHVMKTAE